MGNAEADNRETAKWDPAFTEQVKNTVGPVVNRWFRAEVRNLDNVPAAGGALVVSNHSGGVLGGISTGQPVVARFAVKPTSSILSPRRTVDRKGADTDITTKGRHDPCVGIRAVPVGEAMMACVLADHFLRHRGQVGG